MNNVTQLKASTAIKAEELACPFFWYHLSEEMINTKMK